MLSQAGEHSDVIMGLGYDNTLDDKLGITLIATGFQHKDPFMQRDPKKEEAKKEDKIVMVLGATSGSHKERSSDESRRAKGRREEKRRSEARSTSAKIGRRTCVSWKLPMPEMNDLIITEHIKGKKSQQSFIGS